MRRFTRTAALNLIRSYQGLATLEWHSKKWDVYFNGGAEYAGRAAGYDPIENKFIGYGSPNFSNKGCYTETAPGVGTGFIPGSLSSCTADTRVLLEGTAGYWYRIYTGPKGRLQYGIQYSYVARDTWHRIWLHAGNRRFAKRAGQYGVYILPLLPAVVGSYFYRRGAWRSLLLRRAGRFFDRSVGTNWVRSRALITSGCGRC